jgi:hypothetical protein
LGASTNYGKGLNQQNSKKVSPCKSENSGNLNLSYSELAFLFNSYTKKTTFL